MLNCFEINYISLIFTGHYIYNFSNEKYPRIKSSFANFIRFSGNGTKIHVTKHPRLEWFLTACLTNMSFFLVIFRKKNFSPKGP